MKTKYAPIVLGIVTCLSVMGFVYNWDKQSQAEFSKSEINDHDYYALVAKYDYIKGSKQGEEFMDKLKATLSDQMVSRIEYEKLTGDKATISVYEKPELANLYKDAKSKLIGLTKS